MSRKRLLLIIITSTLPACSGTALNGDEFRLSGTPEGIRAFSDWQVGTINEAQTPSGTQGSHYKLREKQIMIKLGTKKKPN